MGEVELRGREARTALVVAGGVALSSGGNGAGGDLMMAFDPPGHLRLDIGLGVMASNAQDLELTVQPKLQAGWMW